MIIALGSPRVAASIDDGLQRVKRLMDEAARQRAEIICFPEAYLPGLRGLDFDVSPYEAADQERALHSVRGYARTLGIAVILGMERIGDDGRQIAAFVIDARGELQGVQTKNQLDPSEDRHYVPGTKRQLFEINGVKFGISICHEGWRYPETVRWAAVRGAKIVFHPQLTGTTREPATGVPYYPEAMRMRSRENTIYFASVNYALPFQESATSVIAPSGEIVGELRGEGVLVQTIDIESATGLLASRFAPDRC